MIKPCRDCGAALVGLHSTAQRICSGCQKYWSWKLSEGQKPVGYSVCPDKINEITKESESRSHYQRRGALSNCKPR